MGPVRIRIARAIVADAQCLLITSLDKNDRKISMTVVSCTDNEAGEVLVFGNGILVSENESNYDDCFELMSD